MLKRSFIHVQGIGKKSEASLWKSGILTWEDLINNAKDISPRIVQEINSSLVQHKKNNLSYFAKVMPKSEHWRVYDSLKSKTCFLDIETTGLSKSSDEITIIGLYDGKEPKIFVQGKNMRSFVQEIKNYDMVVTYNGACFDLPFISNKIPDVKLPRFHTDLRFAMKRIGFSGGLKKIEKDIGIYRGENIKDIDGFEAVRLWKNYLKGDEGSLQKLIDYNTADVINLKPMMDFTFNRLCEDTFIYHK